MDRVEVILREGQNQPTPYPAKVRGTGSGFAPNPAIKFTLRIFMVTLLLLLPMVTQADQSITDWVAKGVEVEKETGIPPLRLPGNIPSQKPPFMNLVYCSVQVAGQKPISIFLKRSDCLAWVKSAEDYNKKYGQALGVYAVRHQNEENRVTEEKRQQQAGTGRKIIYALFLCFSQSNMCQRQGAARVTYMGTTPDMLFSSLDACDQYAQRVSGLVSPPENGRFIIPNGMWYECRGKSVATWDKVQ